MFTPSFTNHLQRYMKILKRIFNRLIASKYEFNIYLNNFAVDRLTDRTVYGYGGAWTSRYQMLRKQTNNIRMKNLAKNIWA